MNRLRTCVAICAGMLAGLAAHPDAAAQAKAAGPVTVSEARYEVLIDRDITIPMRDGVGLIADVYRPAKAGKAIEGKFPVILIRTCYDKDTRRGVYLFDASFFTKRGYIVVIQDVRGRYKSPGRFYHGIYEGKDGYDTVEWIAKQPWSTGKVGMTGLSYLGAVQQATAAAGAPHLASMFHVEAPISYYQNGVRRGGAFVQMVVPVAFYFASTSKEALADPILKRGLMDNDMKGPEWLKRWPFDRGKTMLSRVPEDERFLIDTWVNTDYDKYYRDVHLWEPILYLDQYTDAAGFYFTGWYDQYRGYEFYSSLRPRKKSPLKLLVGPWGHGTNATFLGDVDFGPAAALTEEQGNELQLRWFDQTLKGTNTGILNEPPVRLFRMGGGDGRKDGFGRMRAGGSWIAESSWPLTNTKFTNYYLGPKNSLSTSAPPAEQAPSQYTYDPKDPVPTIGGASYFVMRSVTPSKFFVPYGPQNQVETKDCLACKTTLPLSARHDVLVFETPPLEQDVEVTGPLTVKLWVSSSAPSTDFTAKLIDVYPPNEDYPEGYAMNLADGILRTHYRNGFEKREMMKPGQSYEITIPMFATSNLFKKGHRIRVDISSSDYPAYDPNPNTGEAYMVGNAGVPAKNVVYHDQKRPSHIILPIIPR